MSNTLQSFGPGIFIASRSLSAAGMKFGARMTVIQLQNSDLLLHSPINIRPEMKLELEQLGRVRFIVAPNNFHHLFVPTAKEQFPDAQVYATRQLASRKMKHLKIDHAVDFEQTQDLPWSQELPSLLLPLRKGISEWVFFHPASRSLVLTDLAFNFGAASGWDGFLKKLAGCHDRFGPSRLMRMVIKNKAAVAQGLRQILQWDFDSIVLSHGDCVKQGAKQKLQDSFAWLL